MSIDEHISQLNTTANSFDQLAAKWSIKWAEAGLDLVRERSIAQGVQLDGQTETYDAPQTTFRFIGSGAKPVKASGKSGPVKLYRTGAFWRSFKVIDQQKTADGYRVTLGSNDATVAKYLPDLYAKWGNVLPPNDAELNTLLGLLTDWINTDLKNLL